MDEQYGRYNDLIDNFLKQTVTDFKSSSPNEQLFSAMEYSLLSGGKRIRPVIALAFCEMCGGKPEDALPFACAIELIHTYSLIHDDLPCMDNDDMRRGKPTNHKVYGEATALLAGDALLTYALSLTLHLPEAAQHIINAAFDMVRGQSLELDNYPHTDIIYKLKTAALFTASAAVGCIAAGKNEHINNAVQYGEALGMAFQYRDDILDNDSNLPEEVKRFTAAAEEAVAPFQDNAFLLSLTEQLSERKQ